MMTNAIESMENLIKKIAVQGLLDSFKAGDTLVLGDDVLQAAIERTHPLNRSEYAALLNSPLTLRRLHSLVAKMQQQGQAPTAANDAYWSGSQCILRAADSGATAPSLTTADGWWLLAFLPSQDGYQMVLKLDKEAPFANHVINAGVELLVCDGQGKVVLTGILDEDGELEARWTFNDQPYAYFVAAGGTITVQPS